MVFLENVPTFVTRGWFRRPGEELSRLGYKIAPPLFLAASDVGAPHIRERVFILAHTKIGGDERQHIASRALFRAFGSCEELAYRDSARENTFAATGGPRRAVGECCGDVANTEYTEWRQGHGSCGAHGADADARREESPRGAGVGCEALATPERDALRHPEQRGQSTAQAPKCGEPEPGHDGPDVGHAEQLDGGQGPVQPVAIQPPYPWPPGPSDWERWAEVEEALEPSFCRVVDGVPDWMDFTKHTTEQLRALGNAVVPVVAAAAFRILCEEVTP